jgi:ABC-type glycerol-3-phosphate transport system substrate-binding protein
MDKTPRTWIALVAGGLMLAGCGGGNDYKNDPRPPSPINVTAFVSAKRVSASPNAIGAGPIVVIVTNQSNSSQDVTFQTDLSGGKGDVAQSTGPINPGDTGQIKVDVVEGQYVVKTGDDAIHPASVKVGPERASAQNDVLQP